MSSGLIDLIKFLRTNKDIQKRATVVALYKIMTVAHKYALKNIKRKFIGRNGRKLSGAMFNSVFSDILFEKNQPTAYLGTRNIPYGRIHELGGEIVPKPDNRMQRLWIPNHDALPKRMSPSEFIKNLRNNPSSYVLTDSFAGIRLDPFGSVLPYFWLVQRVQMPKRPYIMPAIEMAFKKFGEIFFKTYQQEAAR